MVVVVLVFVCVALVYYEGGLVGEHKTVYLVVLVLMIDGYGLTASDHGAGGRCSMVDFVVCV